MIFPKNDPSILTAHFKAREFDCPCDDCKETELDLNLVYKLEDLRQLLKSPIKVTSGYRCANYQKQLQMRGYETAQKSQHLLGRAADISNGVTPGYELEDLARQVGFKAVGVGKTFIHVDLRDDKVRRWTYARS